MKIHTMEQHSPEWFRIRTGKATASEFSKILTPTGRLSASADGYARRLARECFISDPEETAARPSKAMQWGTNHEPEAREQFMLDTGIDVQQVGFVTCSECSILGCSPDGFIYMDQPRDQEVAAGLEIKCPSIDTLTEWLLAIDKDPDFFPPEYMPQVHGSMVVTGLRTWHFRGHFPGGYGKTSPTVFTQVVQWNSYTDRLRKALFEFADRYETIFEDVCRVLGKGSA